MGRTCYVQKLFLTIRTISVHNMLSPCSAKRRASDKDLPLRTYVRSYSLDRFNKIDRNRWRCTTSALYRRLANRRSFQNVKKCLWAALIRKYGRYFVDKRNMEPNTISLSVNAFIIGCWLPFLSGLLGRQRLLGGWI